MSQENTIIIDSCRRCPFLDANDMCAGFRCKLMETIHGDDMPNDIEEGEFFFPAKEPDWCPIKNNTVTLKLKS